METNNIVAVTALLKRNYKLGQQDLIRIWKLTNRNAFDNAKKRPNSDEAIELQRIITMRMNDESLLIQDISDYVKQFYKENRVWETFDNVNWDEHNIPDYMKEKLSEIKRTFSIVVHLTYSMGLIIKHMSEHCEEISNHLTKGLNQILYLKDSIPLSTLEEEKGEFLNAEAMEVVQLWKVNIGAINKTIEVCRLFLEYIDNLKRYDYARYVLNKTEFERSKLKNYSAEILISLGLDLATE